VSAPEFDARAFHRDALVLDGHNDLALRVLEGEDPADRLEGGHLDLPRMREGGFDGGIFAVWIDPALGEPLRRTLAGLEALREWADRSAGVRRVERAADLDTAREAGEVAVVPGVEGGYGIEDDLSALDRMHEVGARCLTLTWMRPTAWADAAGPEPVHGGLTRFGRRVVERARTLGMAVDVSHASDRAAAAAIEVAGGGVLASHSGARAVADHPRNLPDELIEALTASGGVTGVVFFPAYLDEAYGRAFGALRAELGSDLSTRDRRRAFDRAVRERLNPPPLSRLVEHVEWVRRVAGPAGVALGSDFNGVPALPRGLRDVRDLPELTTALAGAGWSADDLGAFLGRNLRRVLGEALDGS
jgi:membrane dipeptidase